MSVATLQESFIGAQLLQPIHCPQRFKRAQLPTVKVSLRNFEWQAARDDKFIRREIRRVRKANRPRPSLHEVFAKKLPALEASLWYRTGKVKTISSSPEERQLGSYSYINEPLEVEHSGRRAVLCVPDDALCNALDYCREHFYPQAGYGRSLPQSSFTYWDIHTDTFVTVDGYVKPKRSAAHATVKGADFDTKMRKSVLPAQYKAGLRLSLVSGWTYKDAAAKSGQSLSAFTRQATRLLSALPHEPFIPKERRFQSEAFAKGFGEVGSRLVLEKNGRERFFPTADGVRDVPYDDGQAANDDDFGVSENIFG